MESSPWMEWAQHPFCERRAAPVQIIFGKSPRFGATAGRIFRRRKTAAIGPILIVVGL
jgi:hypothetical protein